MNFKRHQECWKHINQGASIFKMPVLSKQHSSLRNLVELSQVRGLADNVVVSHDAVVTASSWWLFQTTQRLAVTKKVLDY